jgi:hypothetical protein
VRTIQARRKELLCQGGCDRHTRGGSEQVGKALPRISTVLHIPKHCWAELLAQSVRQLSAGGTGREDRQARAVDRAEQRGTEALKAPQVLKTHCRLRITAGCRRLQTWLRRIVLVLLLINSWRQTDSTVLLSLFSCLILKCGVQSSHVALDKCGDDRDCAATANGAVFSLRHGGAWCPLHLYAVGDLHRLPLFNGCKHTWPRSKRDQFAAGSALCSPGQHRVYNYSFAAQNKTYRPPAKPPRSPCFGSGLANPSGDVRACPQLRERRRSMDAPITTTRPSWRQMQHGVSLSLIAP